MVIAGSTCGSSLMACATVDYELPDLGSANPPAPVPGMTYLRASEIGCALDCDLRTGRHLIHGGEATDDGPRINAAMANASPSNPITLIIDGPALISGLYLPADGSWGIAGLGYGTGFFIKSGSNSDGIHNGGRAAGIPSDPGPPVPARGSGVSLSNFTINGNQGDGHNGDSTTGTYQGDGTKAWDVCINLMNLNNIIIENVVAVNAPSYHFRLSNVGNVTISGCVMRSSGNNTDGIHFDGPANDISITNCDISCGDDAIALNCPEGYRGDIARVKVSNCTFRSLTLMRLYSTGNGFHYNIDTVTISQCTGTFLLAGLAIGDGTGANPKSVTGVQVSDCTLTSPTVLDITANFGTIVLKNVTLTPTDKNFQPGIAFVRASAHFYGPQRYIGERLIFENCAIAHDGGFDVAAIIMNYQSVIGNMVFNGFATNAKALLTIVSGSIGLLTINAIDVTHIKQPVDKGEFADIGAVDGTGVLATGWAFPNSVMANGVPYISAGSNTPSIKVNGVVEPYPQG
jgi:hypothetical protein